MLFTYVLLLHSHNKKGVIVLLLFFSPGYMLIGNDVKLNSPSSLIGQALAEILQYPDRARDALRVLLHLVRHGHTHTHTHTHKDLLTIQNVTAKGTQKY